MICVRTKKPQETEYLGERLAKFFRPGDFLALIGDLGVGKTLLVQGIAKGLGIKENITSPTFTIINQYAGNQMPLYHMDVYRLNSIQEMDDLGYEEFFYGQGLTVVEWGNLIIDLLPQEYLALELKTLQDGREICFFPYGNHYVNIVEELTGCDCSGN